MYEPRTGTVSAAHLDEAIRESERRVDRGEDDVEVVVARNVPLATWEKSEVGRFSSVFIEARYDTEDNKVELVITKVQGQAHEYVVGEITAQLRNYGIDNGHVLRVAGGDMTLTVPNTTQRRIRRPDTALRPHFSSIGDNPPMPRLLVEVEFKHRSVERGLNFCRQYFAMIPQLRTALFLKVFRRRVDDTFASLAVVLRRGAAGAVDTIDMVSFGSAPLRSNTLTTLRRMYPGRQPPRRVAMPPPAGGYPANNPPFLTFQAADLFWNAMDLARNAVVLGNNVPDLEIDLSQIFEGLDPFTQF